jgi:hypothetical protein
VIIEKIPIVIPNKERKVRSLFAVSECQANLTLSTTMAQKSKVYNIKLLFRFHKIV